MEFNIDNYQLYYSETLPLGPNCGTISEIPGRPGQARVFNFSPGESWVTHYEWEEGGPTQDMTISGMTTLVGKHNSVILSFGERKSVFQSGVNRRDWTEWKCKSVTAGDGINWNVDQPLPPLPSDLSPLLPLIVTDLSPRWAGSDTPTCTSWQWDVTLTPRTTDISPSTTQLLTSGFYRY